MGSPEARRAGQALADVRRFTGARKLRRAARWLSLEIGVAPAAPRQRKRPHFCNQVSRPGHDRRTRSKALVASIQLAREGSLARRGRARRRSSRIRPTLRSSNDETCRFARCPIRCGAPCARWSRSCAF